MMSRNREISLADVTTALRRGARVVLQVRHAERPKIDPRDPTFGDTLAITPEGVRTAHLFGEALRDFARDTDFCASPLMRTRMTAAAIAEGMGVVNPVIPTDARIGNDSFYYSDVNEVFHVFTPPTNFFPACFEYMATGRMRGFAPIGEATDALEAWLMARLERRLLVAVTHDCYVAAFLAARGAYVERSRDTWPRFLDAAAIVVEPDGSRNYALVRSGLSSGIVGVGPEVCQ